MKMVSILFLERHMKKIFNFLMYFSKGSFLYAPKFISEIKKRQDLKIVLKIPEQTANSNQIIRWDDWKHRDLKKSYILAFHEKNQMAWTYVPELEHLISVSEIENCQVDIQDIACLSSSKSNLSLFKALNDFATIKNSNLITELSEENLNKNLFWEDKKILNNPFLYCYVWDNKRIHLKNSGGSHHFSAARYIASQLNKKIHISGRLKIFHLNQESICSLLNQFALFAVNNNDRFFIVDECANIGASVGVYDAPPPFYDKTIIFLPHINKRSAHVTKLFQQFGLFNFGDFLLNSLAKQK